MPLIYQKNRGSLNHLDLYYLFNLLKLTFLNWFVTVVFVPPADKAFKLVLSFALNSTITAPDNMSIFAYVVNDIGDSNDTLYVRTIQKNDGESIYGICAEISLG